MAGVLRSFAMVLALGGLAGCATHGPPIALVGNRAALDALVGVWHGEYVSDATRKSGGSIVFILAGNDEIAYGDVLMTRRGSLEPYRRFDPDRSEVPPPRPSQSLTILVVRAHDGLLTGELDPYWDPARECRAITVFTGRIRGDIITGTYETTYRGPYAVQTGTWRVVRKPVK